MLGYLPSIRTGQVDKLTSAGCEKIYKEKQSGAKTDRSELTKLIKGLEAGDTLIVTRLDRFARSTRDLLNFLDILTKRGVTFRSLKDSWVDTCTAQGRLMITMLAGLADSNVS